MKRVHWVLVALFISTPCIAQAQTAEEVLQRIDANDTFDTRTANMRMEIYRGSDDPDVKEMNSWSRGADQTYAVFLSPPRDKGTRYLKLSGNLYMVLPRSEKVVKISGHMLRQGLMDSDFSYEDMLESRALFTDYDATLLEDEEVDGHLCWVLDLREKKPGSTYSRRKLWVAKQWGLTLQFELYAKSGMLLKKGEQSGVKQQGERYYATTLVMRDELRKGSRTVVRLSEVQFGLELPSKIFSRRRLMRGP